MSQVKRTSMIFALGCALLAMLAVGCSKKNGAPFDADSGHPSDFFAKHGASYLAASDSCQECHGGDLLGGIVQVSCSSASVGEQSCHASGPGGGGGDHGAGWAAASRHGATAKGAPGAASGFASCKRCHGSDFKGGTAGKSCFPCHGWNAPHGRSGWDGGGSSHQSTNTGNASVCAQCHQSKAGTPGCFNNTLCHGAKSGHPAGWSAGSQHGATAKAAPGGSSGFRYCEGCHGSGLNGGSANQSCLINSGCHGWSAPHANSGWNGGGSSHRTTNEGNASVCAQCHQSKSGTPGCFNNTLCHGTKSNHPAGWLTSHTTTDQNQASACAVCHQSNPGTPGCFNNTLCHGSKSGHPAGWSAGSQHGATAKAAPGGSSGFLYCEGCHGSGLNGGSANQSCLINSGCHGWSAPHANSGWNGGGSRHRSTNVGNVTVCAQCHPVSAPSSGTTCSHNASPCHGG